MIKHSILPAFTLLFTCFAVLFLVNKPALSQSGADHLEIGIQHKTDLFSELFDPQLLTGIHIGTQRSYGKYLVRANAANRFERWGVQLEAEAFPYFGRGFHAYLNYAYSDASMLPAHRAGAEFFIPLPIPAEISFGGRYLLFNSDDESLIATGSLGIYFGFFLLTFRPFFIFSDNGEGETYTGSLRYLLNERNDHILIRGGTGHSTDHLLFQLGGTGVGEDLLLLESTQIGAEFRHHINRNLIGIVGVDMNHQELIINPGSFVTNWSVSGSIIYRF